MPTGNSVISTFSSLKIPTSPLVTKRVSPNFSISPMKFLYHGFCNFDKFPWHTKNGFKYLSSGRIRTMGRGSSPLIILCKFSIISRGLWFGILVIQPVPMPSAPLTNTIGIIGIYQNGSILRLSSRKYVNKGSSCGWKINLARGLRRIRAM